VRLWSLVEASGGALLPVGDTLGDPPVTGVVTTDLLEPGRYLAGGELVLTGLAWWRPRRPDRTTAFVADLVAARVAALAAGEAELGRVPDDLARACAEAGLPLLRVPVSVPFAAIHEHVAQHLSPRRSDEVAAVLGRHRELIAGGGIAGVLTFVATDLGLHARLLSPTGRLLAGAAGSAVEDRRLAQHYLRALRLPHRVRRPGGRVVSLFAPPGPRAATAVLAVAEDHTAWTTEREEVVAELVSLIALEPAARRSGAEEQLVTALSTGVEVEAAVRRTGLDPDVGAVLIVAGGPHAPAVLGDILAGTAWEWRMGGGPDEAVALVTGLEPVEITAPVRDQVSALSPALTELTVGVSDRVRGAEALVAALAAARAVAATVGPLGVAGPDRLSSHALLLAAVPPPLRATYRERVLGPLLAHDRRHRTELVRTLGAYLECSGSWSRCAALMHVHVNTLRYRIERIEALTGRDLRELADQTDLLLALHLPAS
jgi:DNA-binding PucR family transcriptional regulator